MTEIFLKITRDRPAYGNVSDYLWGPHEDIDSDGNSEMPQSGTWTELTLIKRKDESHRVDIDPVSSDPLILKVSSEVELLAYASAFFIAHETAAEWAFKADGKFSSNLNPLSERAEKYVQLAD